MIAPLFWQCLFVVFCLLSRDVRRCKETTPSNELSIVCSNPRVLLRSWREGDLASLIANADNPEVARGLRNAFPQPYSGGRGMTIRFCSWELLCCTAN